MMKQPKYLKFLVNKYETIISCPIGNVLAIRFCLSQEKGIHNCDVVSAAFGVINNDEYYAKPFMQLPYAVIFKARYAFYKAALWHMYMPQLD